MNSDWRCWILAHTGDTTAEEITQLNSSLLERSGDWETVWEEWNKMHALDVNVKLQCALVSLGLCLCLGHLAHVPKCFISTYGAVWRMDWTVLWLLFSGFKIYPLPLICVVVEGKRRYPMLVKNYPRRIRPGSGLMKQSRDFLHHICCELVLQIVTSSIKQIPLQSFWGMWNQQT